MKVLPPTPPQFGQEITQPMPGPAQGRRRKVPFRVKIAIVSLVSLAVVFAGAGVAYTRISTSTTVLHRAIATAGATATTVVESGNPYGGTLVASDSMSRPGSAFAWDVFTGLCDFKNGAYHVSLRCHGSASLSTKFAFEISLSAGGNCGALDFYSHSAPGYADVSVCQNGSYDLTADLTAANGEASGTTPAMHTGIDQPNLIGIVSDGTHLTLFINHVRVASAAGVYTDLYDIALEGDALGSDGTRSLNFAEVAYSHARLWSL